MGKIRCIDCSFCNPIPDNYFPARALSLSKDDRAAMEKCLERGGLDFEFSGAFSLRCYRRKWGQPKLNSELADILFQPRECSLFDSSVSREASCDLDTIILEQDRIVDLGKVEGSKGLAGAPDQTKCSIINMGTTWKATFAGIEKTLPNNTGTRYIIKLLQHSGEEIHCTELTLGATFTQQREETSLTQGQDENNPALTTTSKNTNPKLNTTSIAFYTLKLDEAIARLEDAEELKNQEDIAKYSQEVEEIREAMRKGRGHDGDLNREDPNIRRQRQAAYMAIERALEKIKSIHPQLGDHLDSNITRKTYLIYKADPRPDWEIIP